MLLTNKTSNTIEDLIYEIKNNDIFYSDKIDQQVIKNSLIKIKDVNTQNYMLDTDYLVAEKYTVEIEFKIGEADLQVSENASFEVKISDHGAKDDTTSFECKNRQAFEKKDGDSIPKVTTSEVLDDSGIEADLEADKADETEHNVHDDSNPEEVVSSTSIRTLILYVNEKTKLKNIIDMIKEKDPSLSQASISLKDDKYKNVNTSSEVKFTNYYVYQDKTTLVLELQVKELILNSDSEQLTQEEKDIFNIFDDIKLEQLMANHCSTKNLKNMIKATEQFNDLKEKVKNDKNLIIKIVDQDTNEIKDETNLSSGQYKVEISVVLKDSNKKAIITFNVVVPTLSHDFSSQLEKYCADIKDVTVKIKTKKDSTEDKLKCEDKIKNSEEIKNIFKNDEKVLVEYIEILQPGSYNKGTTYKAKITFCFKKCETVSRQQVEFSFIVE